VTVSLAPTSEPITRRWTTKEFYQLAEDGWFEGQRVLLLEGEIIQLPPMNHPHAFAATLVRNFLLKAFGDDHWVREDKPLNATEDSDPEPDLAVSEHPMREYRDHPSSAILVVEVSDTTVPLDRRKAAIYAEAGVQEYWLLNLKDRQLEVYRLPDRQGRSYGQHQILSENDSIAPSAKPSASVVIKELLP
jgi:Uma2 family endonuclease